MTEEEQFAEIVNKPALDKKTMYIMEKAASSNGVGKNRRIMLASLTRGLEDMVNVRLSDKETFDVIKGASDNFLAHAKAVYETAQKAVKRLELADKCGEEPIEA